MNKNQLIKIAVKEIQELETLVKNFSDKIDNIKSLIELLEEEKQEPSVKSQDETAEKAEKTDKKPVVAETPPAIMEEIPENVVEEEPEIVVEKEPEIVVEEVKPVIEKKIENKKNILADTIKTTSLNEKMSEKANKSLDQALSSQKITDLKRGISLNDKFRFQREIFGGNAALLDQTLEALNEMESKEEATEFLSKLNLNEENQAVTGFLELVNRKFL